MGKIFSKQKVFVVNNEITGQGADAQEIFDLLELSAKDINQLYGDFCKVDVDGGGTIMNLELYFHLLKDRSVFLDTVFSIFDEDRSGQLDFLEFVVSLWSLNTLMPQHIGGFAFLMCDTDGSGDLTLHEIAKMFEILYPNGGSEQCIATLKNDVAFEGTLNVVDFVKWTQDKMSVMSPLLRLQAVLQEAFGGTFFWRRLAKNRTQMAEEYLRHPKCISQMREKVRQVRDKSKELRQMTEKKKVLAVKSVSDVDPKKSLLIEKYVKMVAGNSHDLKMEKKRQDEEARINADPLKAAMERFKINVNDPKPKEPFCPSTAPPGTNPFREFLYDKQEKRKARRADRALRRSGKTVVPVGTVDELLNLATGAEVAAPIPLGSIQLKEPELPTGPPHYDDPERKNSHNAGNRKLPGHIFTGKPKSKQAFEYAATFPLPPNTLAIQASAAADAEAKAAALAIEKAAAVKAAAKKRKKKQNIYHRKMELAAAKLRDKLQLEAEVNLATALAVTNPKQFKWQQPTTPLPSIERTDPRKANDGLDNKQHGSSKKEKPLEGRNIVKLKALVHEERERKRSTKGLVGRAFCNHTKMQSGPSIMMLDTSLAV